MDTSRFKRRETQTRRQVLDGDFRPRQRPAPTVPKAPQASFGAAPLRSQRQSRPAAKPLTEPIIQKQRVVGDFRPLTSMPRAARRSDKLAGQPAVPKVATRQLPPIDMSLPDGESPFRRVGSLLQRGRWGIFRHWAFRGTAGMMAVVMLVTGLLFSQGYLKLHKVFKGNAKTAASLNDNVDPNLLKGEGDGRVNILLLGRGGGTHDAPDLTDTMMLASVDPVNHTATLLSVPRDLWIDMPGQGAMKLNAAWETGEFKYLGKVAPGSTKPQAIQAGFDQADQMVEQVLGVTINYNAIVDFQAFQQAVDTVHGVNVTVPEDLVDPTMAWENAGSSVLAKAGQQTFDGRKALIYVRSRETTSDFARSQRQRTVMLALKDKVDTLGTLSNPVKISGLMNAFGNNVSTDLSLNNASRLYSLLKKISDNHITSIGLGDDTNKLITTTAVNGQSVVVPLAGTFNYGAIQNYVRSQLRDPYLMKEHARVLVLNGTSQEGLATTKADELKSYGYNVVGVSNAPTKDYNQTLVIDMKHPNMKYTKHYLEQRFNTTATTQLPGASSSFQTNGADFVIIVGSDEVNE